MEVDTTIADINHLIPPLLFAIPIALVSLPSFSRPGFLVRTSSWIYQSVISSCDVPFFSHNPVKACFSAGKDLAIPADIFLQPGSMILRLFSHSFQESQKKCLYPRRRNPRDKISPFSLYATEVSPSPLERTPYS